MLDRMRRALNRRTRGGRSVLTRVRLIGARRWPRDQVALPDVRMREGPLPFVTCIVFSKDRAMQLDACLRSIKRYAPYIGPIVVVYRTTTSSFEAGYATLDRGERTTLMRQSSSFRADVVEALKSAGEYVIFHTDDDVFFRPSLLRPILNDDFAAFSLRLGLNTTYCHTRNRSQVLPALKRSGALLAWNWSDARDDFSYPMSLNGHLFRTSLVKRMLARAHFSNPNELEDELHLRRYLAPRWMLACQASSVVSIPINIVTATHTNRSGSDPALAVEELNKRFLAGERIDLEAMDFSHVEAAHQEVALAFTQGRSSP
jgi:hypothetical protein